MNVYKVDLGSLLNQSGIMSKYEFIRPVRKDQLEIIYKGLGEDKDRLENRRDIFKQWINCENHLPKDINQKVIDNFIRLSKFDVERAKRKFEMWLLARTKYPCLYGQMCPEKSRHIQRLIFTTRGLTEDGYRIVISTFKNIDIDSFDYEQFLLYCMLNIEYFLYKDVNAGCVIIMDLGNITTQMVSKINMALFKAYMDVMLKVEPTRIKQVHITNLSTLAQGLLAIAKAIMPAKIQQRIIVHSDISTVVDYIKPKDILPDEFGGSDGTLEELTSKAKEYILNDEKFHAERAKWVLTGELPTDKKKMYTFGDTSVVGSFRKLQID